MNCLNEWVTDILSKLASNRCFQEALIQASAIYQLKPYNIMNLSPQNITQLYNNLYTKFYQNSSTNSVECWLQNQLRVFVWILIGFAFINNKPISSMDESDWNTFSLAFNLKDPNILEFQSKFLLKTPSKSKKWAQEESDLLSKIVNQRQIKNKWNEVAKTLFIISDKKYFRTPKQCREQWINHLDPSKRRTSWTTLEDYELIQSIIKNGKKWSKVAKDLGEKRTEHMVKNRFKSLLNFQKKRIGEEDDEELLIKKMNQRLQSCQALKKLQEAKKEMKDVNGQSKMPESIEVNQLVLPQEVQPEISWNLDEFQIKEIEMHIQEKPTFKDNECIDFFFQEQSFPHF